MSAAKTIKSLSASVVGSDTSSASRDMHKLLDRLDYKLPIDIETINHVCHTADVQELRTYHVKPESWLQFWMNEEPSILGGWHGDVNQNFESFWKTFQVSHSGHAVFQHHNGRLDRVAPVIIHGDEGRAVKRTNYWVLSMQSPFGSLNDPSLQCTCREDFAHRQSGLPSFEPDLAAVDPKYLQASRAQTTNYKGHSYLSHWLLFGVGGWIYKRHSHIIDELVLEISQNLQKLFHQGINTNQGTIFAALVAVKGDLDFEKKLMSLTRSYAHVGTKNCLEICHLCKAGGPGCFFEDFSEAPGWLETVGTERPWNGDDPPAFSQIPFDDTFPEKLLQLDIFHVCKLGVFRDIIGGILILLLRLKFFDYEGSTINMEDRMNRAHGSFALWCTTLSKSPGLRSFSMRYFNMKSLLSAPWANSKGSDSVLLLQWLQHTLHVNINYPNVAGYEQLLKRMLQVVDAALGIRMVHSHRLWLERHCAHMLYYKIMTTLRGYTALARDALRLQVRAFVQKPKQHSLHHIGHELKSELQKGATLILNPQCFGCEMSEDFIGRVSRLSRRVGFRLVHLRVIQRYFVKVRVLLDKRRKLNPERVWTKKTPIGFAKRVGRKLARR